MSDGTFNFGNIDALKRNRDIEGETGTELGLAGGITLIVLAATDANVGWRNNRDDFRAELNRLSNAKAGEDRTRAYIADFFSRIIVKDWRGVLDQDGNAIPFSREACRQFLIKADDAFTAVNAMIYDTQNFRGARVEAVAADAKN